MAFTFDINLGTAISRIRLDLGDTVEEGHFLEDETITAMLAHQGNDEQKATVALANVLISRYAHSPSKVTLPDEMGSVEWKDRLTGWQELVGRVSASTGGFKLLKPSRGEACSEYRREDCSQW